MKPPPFAYHAPTSLTEAVHLLAEHGDEAKLLAGGQSLVPLLSLRLARPSAVVDLNAVDGLSTVEVGPSTTRVGAMARHRVIERSDAISRAVPLVAAAAPFIGHVAIRTRGTVGGSLSHADPAAELPAVALALGATFTVSSVNGDREVSADEFFAGYFTTSLEADEVLTAVTFPNAAPQSGVSVQEVARRHGDFALVGAVASVTLNNGVCDDARVALINVADRPVRSVDAEASLRGSPVTAEGIDAAAEVATRDLSPVSDLHATAAYRRSVAKVLVRRALTEAATNAKGGA